MGKVKDLIIEIQGGFHEYADRDASQKEINYVFDRLATFKNQHTDEDVKTYVMEAMALGLEDEIE